MSDRGGASERPEVSALYVPGGGDRIMAGRVKGSMGSLFLNSGMCPFSLKHGLRTLWRRTG